MNVQNVHKLPFELHRIFSISSEEDFRHLAIQTFRYQYENNPVYHAYVELLNKNPEDIQQIADIPFLPISFFKSHQVKSFDGDAPLIFESSGTTADVKSQHHILDPTMYQLSFFKAFEQFYGHLEDYVILALLPSYMDNDHSSLIYMIDQLIEHSKDQDSGFFLNDPEHLVSIINRRKNKKKILLFGVSFALLDLAEKFQLDLNGCYVMETGGMKGRRKEITKTELHANLKTAFNLESVHSEYGMTELLSQAYSQENEVFHCPPWMKVLIRQYNDPLQIISSGSGGINVIDLANIHSCSFIATDDLGKQTEKGGFEVLGRMDNSDVRGCNLLVQ